MRQTSVTPIAVVGMACRLPGGIDSPHKLWAALLEGADLVTEIPADRWDGDDLYDPEPGVPGRSVSKWGAFIDDATGFDPDFFGINEREATAMDPQHRVLLETCWEATEQAGFTPSSLSGTSTGVFIGMSHDDYAMVTSDAGAFDQAYAFTGNPFSMASGRISHALGLHGPALTTDTACSSSLVAVHQACRSLHEGESDMALAGGVMLMLDQRLYASSSGQGMLSPTGRCHSFDVAADGFVRAEGCGVVVLKRLDDAQRDGDRVLAVIKSTASNQDGRTDNILTPSKDAQVSVFQAALSAAGVDPDTVGMVEGHGTGTPVGDTIEFNSISSVYGKEGPCALTSVKSNFGHAESAAGVLGLMKAVLAVHHGVIPQNLHFNQLPEKLSKIKTGMFIPTETTAWPKDGGPRRAGVSSYGMSGTNVHAVLEQAPESPVVIDADSAPAAKDLLFFPVSSTSVDGLRNTAARLADWVDGAGEELSLTDLGYTLSRRRGHRSLRTAVIAEDRAGLIEQLRQVADGDEPYQAAAGHDDRGPVWIFSGQGSQWASMGSGLLATEPVFAAKIAEIEPLIAAESGFSVTEAMTAPETVEGIHRVQPTIFAVQVAMAATMRAYGVQPGAVIGHSLGEVAAAVVSGALSLEDGVKVICRRSLLCLRLAGGGAMASVEMPAQQVREELEQQGIEDVVVAVVASPKSTVIGGATETVRKIVAGWEAREIMAREVNVDVASHSPQVDPILDELAEMLDDITPMAPEVPYYSATSFDPREQPYCDADYWVDNLRHTVRFSAAVQTALEDGFRVFGELAPHPLLIRAIDQTAGTLDITVAALAGMRRGQEVPNGLGDFLGDLYAAGAQIDFSVLYPAGRLVDAPLSTWTHRSLVLVTDGTDHQARGAHLVAAHPLLGSHVRLLEEPERHAWAAEVGTAAHPWLVDHQINNVAALPGAAYCEMALAAARTVFGDDAEVRDVTFERMLLLKDETPVSAVASAEASGALDFVVETDTDGERERRAGATLCAAESVDRAQPYDMDALREAHPNHADGEGVRQWFDGRGVQFGPAFTALLAVNAADESTDTVLAEIGLHTSIRNQQSSYGVHPALLDACFQSVAAHPGVQASGTGGLLLPLGVDRLRVHGPTRNARYCLTRVTSLDGSSVQADIDLLDDYGTVLFTVEGLRMGSGMSEDHEGDRVLNERLLGIEWRQHQVAEIAHTVAATWLVISTSDAADLLSSALTDALKLNDADVTTMSWPQQGDHTGNAERLGSFFSEGGFHNVVVVSAARNGCPEEQLPHRGGEHVRHLVRISRELADAAGEPPRLYVITRNAQSVLADDRPNLEQAGLRGLLRVIGAEYPQLRPSQIDVDDDVDSKLLARVLLSGSEEDETAFRNGEWYTAHLYPSPLRPDERYTTVVDHARDGMRLEIRTPGDMQTLELAAFDRIPPGPGQIEVAVTASSLNFADVLLAFGRYPSFEGLNPQLGIDFAGVVTAVGPQVTSHRVGDHVGGMSPNGCWGTFVTCDADVAVTLPPGLRDDQAAAVSTAAATAWHSLHDLARISSGDKVLIHSATGGVGQAAIAITRAAGAEVFATAGTEERRDILRDMGITHVYDSRSTAFAEEIRRDTDGYGVDIVLNSLTGAAQRAGVDLLAFGGRFVEIGKKDIYGDTRLGLFPFRRNLSFYGVDLALMSTTHPEQIRELLNTVYRLTAEGVLPQPETTHYPLADAATAIRVMGAAEHTGKLLLSVPKVGHSTVVVPPEQAKVFRRDGSYIITGGLGGLGLFLASKMAAAGCGRLVLNSRSEPRADALAEIARMRAAGTEVEVVSGDIALSETVDRLVEVATATGLAVRGVLHAAAVVEDAILTNISDELIDRDWAPKVYGAWHLHRATTAQPLDWFCSFSSAAALMGSPGQGAYAAANSWLDGFTHWRRSQGLPATAIAWAAWDEIGAGKHLAASGETTMISPDEGAHAFEALLRHDRAYSGYAPIIGTPWLTDLAARSPFAEAFLASGDRLADTSTFRAELHELPRDEWPTRIRRLVSEQLSLILRRSIDPDRPISEYGLDSLGNLELRTRIETETGIRVRSMDITTVRSLAESLCETLAGVITAAR
ncbi:sulfolipid-1 biosynthesis phthioceranic/hydroxyphthioceranic acid synthase [Mycobacterium sp. CVI_P3]|uniref:Sulfolipid-1 biosynthesis phthioceranic/hydroxyphthioceranic acid synthase n=1 Tax=Mycobacterium pinniadriaticum TaxID=2994102 RepID=A0ABT3SBI7_9MYCO|nr:sulfolipid-1 biosynthesis phthioceranic/hydroxyphthioceranic acid synthase [Mycobacterium pinniadriaticum]MCX2930206.1 sulfolipid-1 biosynthesis phthioceranic/hydroxyphthioceranic acid synthase [Mycobacterium pinniadriaticum]MCX2936732.1 sulfolipid-1 biosynthesis phthioceranic/hydroxyphthioceranic acid synthase [Mycobacterium pinniadriaticum]